MADDKSISPLFANIKLVNPDGTPTDWFIRWAQERSQEINGSVPPSRKINTGTGLTGGGNLSEDRTISLDAKLGDLKDIDFSTAPTDGQVIVYDAADETWKPADQSGGGGGGSRLLASIDVSGLTTTRFNVPAGLTAIEILANVGITNNDGFASPSLLAQFNGDTGNNYNSQSYGWYGSGGTFANTFQPDTTAHVGYVASTGAGQPIGSLVLKINNPLGTALPKTVVWNGGCQQGNVGIIEGGGLAQWLNTAALATIDFISSTGDPFAAGSVINIFGD